jgi:NADPH:quinone reductase
MTSADSASPEAGVIDAVGEGVGRSRVGERVWLYMAATGRPTGTAAEFTVVPADRAVPLPDEASFEVGASLGVPALTAHRALTVTEDGPRRLRPGALDGAVVLARSVRSMACRWSGPRSTAPPTHTGRRRADGVTTGDLVLGTADWRRTPAAGASDRAIMDCWTPVPAGLDLTQAAALPMAVDTAYLHLTMLGLECRVGDHVAHTRMGGH